LRVVELTRREKREYLELGKGAYTLEEKIGNLIHGKGESKTTAERSWKQ